MAASVSPQDIWDALTRAGASAVQAAGIMGNMIAESRLDPEAKAMDSNGKMSYGLAQWNAGSFPQAPHLVTGNPAADLKAQIALLTSTGGLQAAAGTTVTETADSFAARYERCADCQAGGQGARARAANAQQVASWAASDAWPATASSATTTATLTSAQAADQGKAQQSCAWAIGWGGIPDTSFFSRLFGGSGNVGSGEICLISKPQVRVLLGVGLLTFGTGLILWGAQHALAMALLGKATEIAGAVTGVQLGGAAGRRAALGRAARQRTDGA